MGLFRRLKCWLGFHEIRVLKSNEDPFEGWMGHTGTAVCNYCNRYTRLLGHDFLLPWMKKRPESGWIE